MREAFALGFIALGAGCALVAKLDDFQPAETHASGGASASASGTGASAASVGSTGGNTSVGSGGVGQASSTVGSGGGGGATCGDGKKDGSESDVDCGGSCSPCPIGKGCTSSLDCVTAVCNGVSCACSDHLLISEIRTRSDVSSADEFIELYNPTPTSIVVDSTWTLAARASGGSQYTTRWTGGGQTIPPYAHLLVVGSAYAQSPPGDSGLTSGITDAASVLLEQSGAVVDALCFCYDTGTCQAVSGFTCEGAPATNLNKDTSPGVNMSLERLAGGAKGDCVDTGNNEADFAQNVAPTPQNLQSPPTP